MPEPGDSFALGGATFTVVSPDPDADYADEINNGSIVLRAEYGDVRFLLMGDAETPVETDLLDAGLDLRADVLKVGHHGSSTSSKRAFLEAVDPDYACITCDYTEKAGAPHEEVAERLDDLDVTVLRTDLQGVLTVSTDGSTVNVTTESSTSGVASLEDAETVIYATDGTLHINGACGRQVRIYSVSGQLVYTTTAAESTTITLAKGLYVVMAGDTIKKVML